MRSLSFVSLDQSTLSPRPLVSFGGLVTALIVGLAGVAVPAHAQTKALGAYEGTVTVSGTETGGITRRVNYKATIKINMPVTDASPSSATLEIGDVREPSAMVTINQWDLEERNASPDSDGNITSWKCQLAAPATVPMLASGGVNIDYRKRTHSIFVAMSATEPVALNCVNSRSGPYKKSEILGFFFGTNEPDAVPYTELPFTTPARITANYTLVPRGAMKGQYLPQQQEWELILKK